MDRADRRISIAACVLAPQFVGNSPCGSQCVLESAAESGGLLPRAGFIDLLGFARVGFAATAASEPEPEPAFAGSTTVGCKSAAGAGASAGAGAGIGAGVGDAAGVTT